MHRSTAKRRVAAAPPQAAIALTAAAGRDDRTRYGLALLVFMRVVAALWIAQGLAQWHGVLATGPDGASPFSALSSVGMAAAVFFAVVDFVASVGLWLAAPWGGVLWLVAVGAQLLVAVAAPGFFDHPLAVGLADVALVALYLALIWLAAGAADAAG